MISFKHRLRIRPFFIRHANLWKSVVSDISVKFSDWLVWRKSKHTFRATVVMVWVQGRFVLFCFYKIRPQTCQTNSSPIFSTIMFPFQNDKTADSTFFYLFTWMSSNFLMNSGTHTPGAWLEYRWSCWLKPSASQTLHPFLHSLYKYPYPFLRWMRYDLNFS